MVLKLRSEGIQPEVWASSEIQMLEAAVRNTASTPESDAMRMIETAFSHQAAIETPVPVDSDQLVNDIWNRCFANLDANAPVNQERKRFLKAQLDVLNFLKAKRQRIESKSQPRDRQGDHKSPPKGEHSNEDTSTPSQTLHDGGVPGTKVDWSFRRQADSEASQPSKRPDVER